MFVCRNNEELFCVLRKPGYQAMSTFYSIELPLPPRGKAPSLDALHQPEPVLINTLDGKSISGELTSYSPNLDELSLHNAQTNEQFDVSIKDIKTMQLLNSRQFVLTDELAKTSNVSDPDEKQEYELLFVDDSNDIGETLGHITDRHGVHLFVAQAFHNYHHLFVPFSALRDHRIGAYLGQILVEKTPLTTEQLDKGLEFQQEIRSQKLGDILKEQAIVSAEQLEAALQRQKSTPNIRLGEALIQEGIITDEQLVHALETQKQNRSKPLGEILRDMGLVNDIDLRKTLASKLGIPFVNLKRFEVDKKVLEMVPIKMARRHHIMPLCIQDNKLIIAIENPMNRAPVEDIRFHTDMFVEPIMATIEDIDWALTNHYGGNIDVLAEELTLVDDDNQEEEDDFETEVTDSDNALVKLVNKMILDAHQIGASDIHIEPSAGKKKTIIRFRKDGSLQPYVELPASYRNALISRIKIMCDLDISERRKPQDGKIEFRKFGPANIELRVATLPTAGGVEDMVLRVLSNGEPLPLNQMYLNDFNLKNIESLTAKPYGLFLVCGPTGSGKTTTLHSILKHINTPDKKIWTAEDPVEITQRGLRQVQVNPKIDLTFASAMRAFLRADPDVIMVGEMRDRETTSMGVEASLTGHLVFSTLHTNSAPESIVRLLDMGMDPFNFADALLGILAQRLAKTFCKHCKKPHVATDDELLNLFREFQAEVSFLDCEAHEKLADSAILLNEWKQRFGNDKGEITLYEASGCDECGNSGYNGRIALHELLIASQAIKLQIQEHAKVTDIQGTATCEGMLTLKQDGIEKILQGLTDIQQVHAVCIK